MLTTLSNKSILLDLNGKYDLNSIAMAAKKLAKMLKICDIICLEGELGAGKTTFAGFLINELTNCNQNVTSPTFTLLNIYDANKGFPLWHFDLYRLKCEDEIYQLGIDEAFTSGITIIEWPQIISHIIPDSAIYITINFTQDDDYRLLNIK